MEFDERLQLMHAAQTSIWAQKVNQAINNGQFCEWVSAHHPNKLPCEPDKSPVFRNGGYNLGQRVIFSNKEEWLVRLAQSGSVCDEYADEKVAMEVEALSLVRSQTDIPIPAIHSWGPAEANPLGLGPFIMMTFINGVSLEEILREDPQKRTIRNNISDTTMEQVLRQMAQIQLKLFRLDFRTIGSLPTPVTGFPAPVRPLTFKVHDIVQYAGLNTSGDRSLGFSNTTEFFQAVFAQDWQQLVHQPNSIAGEHDARQKLSAFNAVRNLLPGFVQSGYNNGPYKLVCDDLGLANFIVKDRDDVTIVGMVDLEWSYAGPAQLFATPWWLLQTRLTIYDIKFDEGAPAILKRFLRYLDIYKRVLKEEEATMAGYESQQLSSLVEWSQASGAMWLHILLSTGFNYPTSIPFSQLIDHIGADKFEEATKGFVDSPEMQTLVKKKVSQLKKYDDAREQLGGWEDKKEAGKITMETFVTEAAKLC